MEIKTMSLGLKVRKVLRYLRIHGPARTITKVRGQGHLAKTYDVLPPIPERKATGKRVGLIGCGNFAYSNIALHLSRNFGHCIRAGMDPNLNRAASLFERYGLDYYTDDAAEIFADPEIDLVYIASNHATHAEYAIQAIEAGKAVHIEKPHVANQDQLDRLRKAALANQGRIRLGFNRPFSRIGKAIMQHLDSQEGPSMQSWFVVGHPIAQDHWYHDKAEGGRILGNLCHWTDFSLRTVPEAVRYPIQITPTRASKADCDLAVAFRFGDDSVVTLTFSARGETFSGVRERYSAQRGDAVIAMDDFRTLTVDVDHERFTKRQLFNDAGHEASIVESYGMSEAGGSTSGEDLNHVWESARLFLATREALLANEVRTLDAPSTASSNQFSLPRAKAALAL